MKLLFRISLNFEYFEFKNFIFLKNFSHNFFFQKKGTHVEWQRLMHMLTKFQVDIFNSRTN